MVKNKSCFVIKKNNKTNDILNLRGITTYCDYKNLMLFTTKV